MEYGKIETLFERNEKFIVDPTKLKRPVFGSIAQWDVEEKIDGTNIRIMLDPDGEVRFGGRTDRANIPGDLVTHLVNTFTKDTMRAAFERQEGLPSVVLYGEGYGAGIQKGGGNYRRDKSFRLFDVLVDGKWWLERDDVYDVAEKLGISHAPSLGRWTFDKIVHEVQVGIPSLVAMQENSRDDVQAEGIIARPIETLYDKFGKRVILKLKTVDFTGK